MYLLVDYKFKKNLNNRNIIKIIKNQYFRYNRKNDNLTYFIKN